MKKIGLIEHAVFLQCRVLLLMHIENDDRMCTDEHNSFYFPVYFKNKSDPNLFLQFTLQFMHLFFVDLWKHNRLPALTIHSLKIGARQALLSLIAWNKQVSELPGRASRQSLKTVARKALLRVTQEKTVLTSKVNCQVHQTETRSK